MQDGITLSVVTTEAALDALRGEWDALLHRSDASVFQSFEWVRTWWRHFGAGKGLQCLTVREHGTLTGIVPMYRDDIAFFGIPVVRRLLFIGRPLSDYLDIIAAPGREETVAASFAEWLHMNRQAWDVLDVEELPPWSRTVELLPQEVRTRGMKSYRLPGPPCPVVPLPPTFDEFMSRLGPATRSGLRRKTRHLHEDFTVRHVVLTEPGEAVRAAVRTFVDIHGRRWKALGYPSAFDDPNHTEFHVNAAEEFARRGWLRLYILETNGAAVAASLEFNFRGRIYMYQSNASAPEEVMRYSPGLQIKMDAIERGIGEGMTVYDLLRGDEEYKYDHLKAVSTVNAMLRLTPRSGPSTVRFPLYLLIALASKVYRRTVLEVREFRRFRITKEPPPAESIVYIVNRIRMLTSLVVRFVADHRKGNR